MAAVGRMGRRKKSSWEVTEMLRGKVALSRLAEGWAGPRVPLTL